ncbi:arylsulfatase [Lentisphaerota bacterium WC36G]|nr:arylsulfatase [Lentisphaerae bacterium WC36]
MNLIRRITPLCALGAIGLIGNANAKEDVTNRPNVILIIADQWRGDAVGVVNPEIRTPNIDYLASRGAMFVNGFSAVPSCIPARAILMTGLNQWHTGLTGYGGGGVPSNRYAKTLPQIFTEAGYNTQMVGKGHFKPYTAKMGFENTLIDEAGDMVIDKYFHKGKANNDYRKWFYANRPSEFITPEDHGVDWNSWHSRPWHMAEMYHPTAWTMTTAIEYLENQKKNKKPFFLKISFHRPHSPFVPPKYYWEYYANKKLSQPKVGDWAKMYDSPMTAFDPNASHGKQSAESNRLAKIGYYGEVSFIDTQVGRLINYMRGSRGNDFKNTWIIVTSDHGDQLGDHNLWRKTYPYQGSVRIPFIVVPPAKLRGKFTNGKDFIRKEVVELQDIMPTLLSAANLDVPKYLDGLDITKIMKDKDAKWREYLHGEHSRCYSAPQANHFLTDGKVKYIWLPQVGQEQFFDLENDPDELIDLAQQAEYQEQIALWRQRLIKELAPRGEKFVKDGKLVKGRSFTFTPWYKKTYTGQDK